MVKISTERLEKCQMAIVLEMEPADLDQALRQTASQLARQYSFPGYRKGKAPYYAVVRAVGRETLQNHWFGEEGEKLIKEALEGLDLQLYTDPELESMEWDPLRIRLLATLPPSVDLGDYRSLRIEPEPVEVSDEQVEAQLRELQIKHTQRVAVDRPAAEGDEVVTDLTARVGKTTILDDEAREWDLSAETSYPIPGFYAHLVGMAAGESKTLSLALPDDYEPARYAGAEAEFVVTLREVREKEVPPLDDDLSMTVGDYDTLDELRAAVRLALEEETRRKIETGFPDRVVKALIERAVHLDYPDQMVEKELDTILQEMEENLEGSGVGLEQYFQLLRTTREEYRRHSRPLAEARLKRNLALVELIRREGLGLDPQTLEAEIERMEESLSGDAGELREHLRTEEGRASAAGRLLADRVTERLLAIVRGEAPELPPEEPEAEPEPAVETSAEPPTEPLAEPEPAAEPPAEPSAEPEPAVEPPAEPSAEPEA